MWLGEPCKWADSLIGLLPRDMHISLSEGIRRR